MRGRHIAGLLVVAMAMAVAVTPREAHACGGCFHGVQQSENPMQVTGHRMVLALDMEQTTLYDQIEYAGEPESFAWVLPIKGVASVGLSSDLLFNVLDSVTGVTIASPIVECAPPCPRAGQGGNSFTGTTSSTTTTTTVQVLAHETVGPYETVQLASDDPNALADWLAGHGYAIPPEMKPVIGDYVADGFNFLALKLVPGKSVSAMRPVRVTTEGAGPALPLRMVAAGTGATTSITLWVIGEGRYQPANFSWFVIDASELVWDWDGLSSNYSELREQRFDESGGLAWLVESAEPLSQDLVRSKVGVVAASNPDASGYGNDPEAAKNEAQADLDTLFAGLEPSSVWFTRLHGELSRPAFDDDLLVEAALQDRVPRLLNVSQTIGSDPCPPPPECGTGGAGSGSPAGGAPPSTSASASAGGSGCAASGSTSSGTWWSLATLLVLLGLLVTKRHSLRDHRTRRE